MSRDKERYRELSDTDSSLPLFMRSWWLDAVSSDGWDIILYEEGGEIMAAMPYTIHKKLWFRSIIPLPLSPISGIWIRERKGLSVAKEYSYIERVNEFFAKEIDGLGIDWLYLHFHHSYTNWLGLYWNGFSQTTRYTYRVLGLEDLDSVFSKFHQKTRKSIRLAEKELRVIENIDLDEFYRINAMTFERQGIDMPYSKELVDKIIEAGKDRNAIMTLAALDESDNIHSVLMVVLDNEVCYSLIAGSDPNYRDSGANSLLNWVAMQKASMLSCKEFDFTGSMIRPIEKYMRHFGAIQTPYFAIEKSYSKLYKLIRDIRK